MVRPPQRMLTLVTFVIVFTACTADGQDATAVLGSRPAPTATETRTDSSRFFLDVTSPDRGQVVTSHETITVRGHTRPDAVVSLNDTLVAPDRDGRFAYDFFLRDGPNLIEITASVSTGETGSKTFEVIYLR
ncbi:MAG: hypothetical protein WD208_00935 [Dehalococcoidia bacterium]